MHISIYKHRHGHQGGSVESEISTSKKEEGGEMHVTGAFGF
jgi:hypothetical protein